MSLASHSANADHIARQLSAAADALRDGGSEAFARSLATVLAELDHRLRTDVDAALGRLEVRIEEELRELAEAEQ